MAQVAAVVMALVAVVDHQELMVGMVTNSVRSTSWFDYWMTMRWEESLKGGVEGRMRILKLNGTISMLYVTIKL
jgi:hypothetical protein